VPYRGQFLNFAYQQDQLSKESELSRKKTSFGFYHSVVRENLNEEIILDDIIIVFHPYNVAMKLNAITIRASSLFKDLRTHIARCI